MKVERVRLANFKCYGDADLRLDAGVTVIHGLNGSGKSSLLEACFFALYGARALDETLDDVVTIGAEEATVELWFTHDGANYHVERRVRATGERATTAKCVLETPDGTFEGARDVRTRVTELLRMDAEAFVNCAYVRQGEVNKLINASPSDRQDMLDDLLQLGKLEEYRERASDARLGVKHVLDNKEGELDGLDEQIERKAAKGLHATLNDLESRLADLDDDIERYEQNRDNAEETRTEAEAVLEEYEEKRAELAALEDDIAGLRETIRETEGEREQLAERIGDLKTEAEASASDGRRCSPRRTSRTRTPRRSQSESPPSRRRSRPSHRPSRSVGWRRRTTRTRPSGSVRPPRPSNHRLPTSVSRLPTPSVPSPRRARN